MNHITRAGLAALVGAIALCYATSALAAIPISSLTTRQQQAVAAVQARVAPMAPAQTPQEATQQQAALQPAVAAVAAAGSTAVTALLNTTGQSNPSVAADLAQYLPRVSSRTGGSGPAPAPSAAPAGVSAATAHASRVRKHSSPIAHAAGCWGAWTSSNGIGGAMYESVRQVGWCGNGSSITWMGEPVQINIHAVGLYCVANFKQDVGSWEVHWSWIHMGIWGTLGVSYPWGCWNAGQDSAATQRIAANGYSDWNY